jgi:hypothetical protein
MQQIKLRLGSQIGNSYGNWNVNLGLSILVISYFILNRMSKFNCIPTYISECFLDVQFSDAMVNFILRVSVRHWRDSEQHFNDWM